VPHKQHTNAEGDKLPSVTEIKGVVKLPFLEFAIRRECDCPTHRVRNGNDGLCGFAITDIAWGKKRDDGTAVHEAIEEFLKEIR
jgi:hypothetical protein